jgi:hypothetical protein
LKKKMLTFRQTCDLPLAALKDAGLGHGDVRKAVGTFGNLLFSRRIDHRQKAATELRHLGERVRLATWSNTVSVPPCLMSTVSGSKSQPGSGVPAFAFENRSVSFVVAPSATFLQKSRPSAALNSRSGG